jgi:hypothetical protein
MDIQKEINSTKYKMLLGSMKDGVPMIPFKYCFGDGTCLLDFITNWNSVVNDNL